MCKYIIILLLTFSGSVFADTDRFECVVTYLYTVVSDGTIVDDTDYLKNQIGSTFYVDRKSGVIRGGYFISNEYSETISVTPEKTPHS